MSKTINNTKLCITLYLAPDTTLDLMWKSLLFPLNTLPFIYRSSIKDLIKNHLDNNDINTVKKILSPLLNILNELRSFGLYPRSTPLQIKNSKKHLNAPKSPKRFLLQALENIDSLLVNSKRYKSIICSSTLFISKACKAFTDSGLRKMINPHYQNNLFDIVKRAEKRRLSEIVERVRGICEYYQDDCKFYPVAIVITPSSSHHPFDVSGRQSKTWIAAGKPTPRETYDLMQKSWRKVRAACARNGIDIKGLMTPEPNKKGVPHLNLLLFFLSKEQADIVNRIIRQYFLNDDKEKQFQAINQASHFDRIYSRPIENAMKWAFYMIKNSRKPDDEDSAQLNFPALVMNEKLKPDYEKIEIWHETWGIRRYNFFGQLPIYLWRNLQRLSIESLHEAQDIHSLPQSVVNLWECASSQKYEHSKNRIVGKYSYREFLRLTEPTSLYYYKRIGLRTEPLLLTRVKIITRPYDSKNYKVGIKIIDPNNPHFHIFLYKTKDLKVGNEHQTLSHSERYKLNSLQLYITLLNGDTIPIERAELEKTPP